VISGNLQGDKWYTNLTPTLIITWNAVIDANPFTRYAIVDQISNTLPTSVVGVNQVSRLLDAPDAWYAPGAWWTARAISASYTTGRI
jgi:hypothetical protein